jgi:hypothetical protein
VNVRAISYRTAATAFVFAALWFVFGAILLWSPLPGSMGIAGPMFAAWFILFFLGLAVAGSLLTVAALNAAFPGRPAGSHGRTTPARAPSSAMWAPSQSPRTPSRSGSSSREG